MFRKKPTGLVKKSEPVQFVFYENDEGMNSLIKRTLDETLALYGKQAELSDVLYGCVKELVINATRANLKRAFFATHNIDMDNMGQYVQGLSLLREAIDSKEYLKYNEELRIRDLWVIFHMEHSADGLKIEVINNTRIHPIEEKRIRMKLQIAMRYTDMAEFFRKEKDETEGAGMGIAIIVNLMRSAGLEPGHFRIWTEDDTTVARIEIPFTSKYEFSRSRK